MSLPMNFYMAMKETTSSFFQKSDTVWDMGNNTPCLQLRNFSSSPRYYCFSLLFLFGQAYPVLQSYEEVSNEDEHCAGASCSDAEEPFEFDL